jgi:hypothetical protein
MPSSSGVGVAMALGLQLAMNNETTSKAKNINRFTLYLPLINGLELIAYGSSAAKFVRYYITKEGFFQFFPYEKGSSSPEKEPF